MNFAMPCSGNVLGLLHMCNTKAKGVDLMKTETANATITALLNTTVEELKSATNNAEEALQAITSVENPTNARNQAIGTMCSMDEMLENAESLVKAIRAIHRSARQSEGL